MRAGIFDHGPLQVGDARLYDPPAQHHSDTSIEAAESIKPHGPRLRNLVLDTIKNFGPCTDNQVAYYTGLDGSTVRPRRIELERAGLVENVGTTIGSNGRKSKTWAVVPEPDQGV